MSIIATKSSAHVCSIQPIDIFNYYEIWKAMVDNVDIMIQETLQNTQPNAQNRKILESLQRRHVLFEDVRASFDVEVKSQLLMRGPGDGNSVLVWAQAEFLRKLNVAMKRRNKLVSDSISSISSEEEMPASNLNSTESSESAYKIPNKKRRVSRAANFKALKSRSEYRAEILRLKRDDLRQQRLLRTQPMPLKLSASDLARIAKRRPAIRKREQDIINTKRSIGTMRKIIGNVGANQEKVAELSRSMLRNGIVFVYLFRIIAFKYSF